MSETAIPSTASVAAEEGAAQKQPQACLRRPDCSVQSLTRPEGPCTVDGDDEVFQVEVAVSATGKRSGRFDITCSTHDCRTVQLSPWSMPIVNKSSDHSARLYTYYFPHKKGKLRLVALCGDMLDVASQRTLYHEQVPGWRVRTKGIRRKVHFAVEVESESPCAQLIIDGVTEQLDLPWSLLTDEDTEFTGEKTDQKNEKMSAPAETQLSKTNTVEDEQPFGMSSISTNKEKHNVTASVEHEQGPQAFVCVSEDEQQSLMHSDEEQFPELLLAAGGHQHDDEMLTGHNQDNTSDGMPSSEQCNVVSFVESEQCIRIHVPSLEDEVVDGVYVVEEDGCMNILPVEDQPSNELPSAESKPCEVRTAEEEQLNTRGFLEEESIEQEKVADCACPEQREDSKHNRELTNLPNAVGERPSVSPSFLHSECKMQTLTTLEADTLAGYEEVFEVEVNISTTGRQCGKVNVTCSVHDREAVELSPRSQPIVHLSANGLAQTYVYHYPHWKGRSRIVTLCGDMLDVASQRTLYREQVPGWRVRTKGIRRKVHFAVEVESRAQSMQLIVDGLSEDLELPWSMLADEDTEVVVRKADQETEKMPLVMKAHPDTLVAIQGQQPDEILVLSTEQAEQNVTRVVLPAPHEFLNDLSPVEENCSMEIPSAKEEHSLNKIPFIGSEQLNEITHTGEELTEQGIVPLTMLVLLRADKIQKEEESIVGMKRETTCPHWRKDKPINGEHLREKEFLKELKAIKAKLTKIKKMKCNGRDVVEYMKLLTGPVNEYQKSHRADETIVQNVILEKSKDLFCYIVDRFSIIINLALPEGVCAGVTLDLLLSHLNRTVQAIGRCIEHLKSEMQWFSHHVVSSGTAQGVVCDQGTSSLQQEKWMESSVDQQYSWLYGLAMFYGEGNAVLDYQLYKLYNDDVMHGNGSSYQLDTEADQDLLCDVDVVKSHLKRGMGMRLADDQLFSCGLATGYSKAAVHSLPDSQWFEYHSRDEFQDMVNWLSVIKERVRSPDELYKLKLTLLWYRLVTEHFSAQHTLYSQQNSPPNIPSGFTLEFLDITGHCMQLCELMMELPDHLSFLKCLFTDLLGEYGADHSKSECLTFLAANIRYVCFCIEALAKKMADNADRGSHLNLPAGVDGGMVDLLQNSDTQLTADQLNRILENKDTDVSVILVIQQLVQTLCSKAYAVYKKLQRLKSRAREFVGSLMSV